MLSTRAWGMSFFGSRVKRGLLPAAGETRFLSPPLSHVPAIRPRHVSPEKVTLLYIFGPSNVCSIILRSKYTVGERS